MAKNKTPPLDAGSPRMPLLKAAKKRASSAPEMSAQSALLFEAIERDNAEQVSALIAAGAPFSATDKSREPALARAASLGATQALSALISAGADPAAIGRDGAPALIWAVRKGQLEAVNALLEVTDPNIRNSFGETALMSAAMSAGQNANGAAVLKALLRVADASLTDPSGQTAEDWARKAGPRGPQGPLSLIQAHLAAQEPSPILNKLAQRREALSAPAIESTPIKKSGPSQ